MCVDPESWVLPRAPRGRRWLRARPPTTDCGNVPAVGHQLLLNQGPRPTAWARRRCRGAAALDLFPNNARGVAARYLAPMAVARPSPARVREWRQGCL